jgi:signal transduction histidine kinase
MRRKRSISLPIVFASVTVALSVALLVGWTLVIVQNLDLTQRVAENVTVLVLGIISFLLIMAMVILLSVFLVLRIREINRQYGFIDSVTHELKTPLASLRLAIETLSRPDLDDPTRQELHAMMLGDVIRLNQFIDDILSVSRLAHREVRPLEVLKLQPLLQEVVAAIEAKHGLSPGWIDLSTGPVCTLRTDPAGLALILSNLLDNALKYSPNVSEPGAVRVTVERDHKHVHVAVSDRGIGIEKKYRKRVFDRFYRVPSEEVRTRSGTGLGLFVSAEITRSLGGKIQVHKGPQGIGSTFVVSLRAKEKAG